MNTFLAIVLGLLSISIHELGHYVAMRRCGIKIQEVSLLGIPLPFLPSFSYQRGDTCWSIHPFVIGAYVQPEPGDQIEAASDGDKLYMYGNGIVANVVYALALSAVAMMLMDVEKNEVWVGLRSGVLLCASASLIWIGRRYVTLFLPILALPILILIAWSMFSFTPTEAIKSGAGGPIAVVASLTGAKNLSEAFSAAAFLSLNLGLVNLAPLYPLDGGRIFSVIVHRLLGAKAKRVAMALMIPTFLIFILYSLGLDVWRVWMGL